MARKLLFGVGLNDSAHLNDGSSQFYRKWYDMLVRCYCGKYQTKNPTYFGCKVSESWLKFSAFKSWMQTQEWQGKELDKDFCGDGKLYSADTCVFISRTLNMFMTDRGRFRGPYPLGVSKQRGRFRASIGFKGKLKYLGTFDTTVAAHAAWVAAKTQLANEFMAKESDPRIVQGIRKYLDFIAKNESC